jgi:hypothetical protein
MILGCRHSKTTWPQTPVGVTRREHVTCVECGREMRYDWDEMRVVRPSWWSWVKRLVVRTQES